MALLANRTDAVHLFGIASEKPHARISLRVAAILAAYLEEKMLSEIFEGLFGKKKKYHELKKENHYQVESENLAVPEVHVDHGDAAPEQEKEEAGHAETGEDESITYDNVAIPEIHVHHKKK